MIAKKLWQEVWPCLGDKGQAKECAQGEYDGKCQIWAQSDPRTCDIVEAEAGTSLEVLAKTKYMVFRRSVYPTALRTEEQEARVNGLGSDNWETAILHTDNFVIFSVFFYSSWCKGSHPGSCINLESILPLRQILRPLFLETGTCYEAKASPELKVLQHPYSTSQMLRPHLT